MMKRTTRLRIAAIAIAATATLTLPTAAQAATTEPEIVGSAQGMTIVGYDRAVAEANGYRIVTDAAGVESSVPITEEAKAREAQKSDPLAELQSGGLKGQVGTQAIVYDEVVGNCGISYIGAEKQASDNVYFETGYVVRDAVQEYTWTVNAQGFISGGSDVFTGGLSDAEFEGTGNITAIGPGVAGVPASSASAQAILVDGAVCFSGGPSVSFG